MKECKPLKHDNNILIESSRNLQNKRYEVIETELCITLTFCHYSWTILKTVIITIQPDEWGTLPNNWDRQKRGSILLHIADTGTCHLSGSTLWIF